MLPFRHSWYTSVNLLYKKKKIQQLRWKIIRYKNLQLEFKRKHAEKLKLKLQTNLRFKFCFFCGKRWLCSSGLLGCLDLLLRHRHGSLSLGGSLCIPSSSKVLPRHLCFLRCPFSSTQYHFWYGNLNKRVNKWSYFLWKIISILRWFSCFALPALKNIKKYCWTHNF